MSYYTTAAERALSPRVVQVTDPPDEPCALTGRYGEPMIDLKHPARGNSHYVSAVVVRTLAAEQLGMKLPEQYEPELASVAEFKAATARTLEQLSADLAAQTARADAAEALTAGCAADVAAAQSVTDAAKATLTGLGLPDYRAEIDRVEAERDAAFDKLADTKTKLNETRAELRALKAETTETNA